MMRIDTFEITRLAPSESGLNYDIWLDSMGCRRKLNTNPYILIRRRFGCKKIYLHKMQKVIPRDLQAWITENMNTLISHWNGEISDKEALMRLSCNCDEIGGPSENE